MKIRLFPNSIRGRLLLVGIVLTSAAMIFATISINSVLDRYVRRNINQSLDGQIGLLVRSVKPDGTIDRTMLQEIGPYTQYRRGWAWRIETPSHSYSSTEKIGLIDFRERGREGHFRHPPEVLVTGRTDDLYVRVLEKHTPGGLVKVTVSAPHVVYQRLRDAAIAPVLTTLAGLGIALLAASLLQLQIGLKPLNRLRNSLSSVRAGKSSRITDEQPAELQPLVAELNDLLGENEAALARARGHVANLAHSLKTPLATLTVKLGNENRDPNGDLSALVAQIDRAIRHHLGRARAASPGAPGRLLVNLRGTTQDLIEALMRIYAERRIDFSCEIGPDIAVRCDPLDLSELLGNLLDNASKWASSCVHIVAAEHERHVQIIIDDDGPGLDKAAIDQALLPGGRLDEREEGHGFGLPIARELIELHGGSLELASSPLGGLRVIVTLQR